MDKNISTLPFIWVEKNEVKIGYPLKKIKSFKGSLIKNWAYNGNWLSTKDFIKEIMPNKNIKLETFIIPRGIGYSKQKRNYHYKYIFNHPWK